MQKQLALTTRDIQNVQYQKVGLMVLDNFDHMDSTANYYVLQQAIKNTKRLLNLLQTMKRSVVKS